MHQLFTSYFERLVDIDCLAVGLSMILSRPLVVGSPPAPFLDKPRLFQPSSLSPFAAAVDSIREGDIALVMLKGPSSRLFASLHLFHQDNPLGCVLLRLNGTLEERGK
ncbi:hypothetical protein [Brevibacillus borstelensis]|uniref:hypothetical protein n=1 Tax=Brevibacillus borstelensis TaxID=45462 RepID=UPI0030C01067